MPNLSLASEAWGMVLGFSELLRRMYVGMTRLDLLEISFRKGHAKRVISIKEEIENSYLLRW